MQVLIFSQFKGTLDLLEEFLSGRGFAFERIDGEVTGSRRQVSCCPMSTVRTSEIILLRIIIISNTVEDNFEMGWRS